MAGCCKYQKQKKQISYDSGTTWQDVMPYEYQAGELLSENRYNNPECGCAIECGADYTSKEVLCRGSAGGDCCGVRTSGVHLDRNHYNEQIEDDEPYIVFVGNCCNYIDDYGLEELPNLQYVILNENIGSLGDYTFLDSINLKEVYITKNNPPTIGIDIFRGVSDVKIYVPDSAVNTYKNSWSSYANLIYPASSKTRKALITTTEGDEYIIPYNGNPKLNGIIGVNGMFDKSEKERWPVLSSITSIEVSESVVAVAAEGAFRSLTSFTIPQSVKYFYGQLMARNLPTLTLPSSIVEIGNYSIGYCWNMQSITIEAVTPPKLGEECFVNTNNCPLYVPAGSVNAYKTADGWSAFASRIQAIP